MATSQLDIFWLKKSCELALRGMGHVSPNPCVGSYLIHKGRIIGSGYHMRYGQAHAEINCLGSVAPADRRLIPESTMYVSLEPCSHHGKTPPCAEAIVSYGIPRVVIGLRDPNPKVAGNGIKILSNAGIAVDLIQVPEAINCATPFLMSKVLRRPHIILKWAMSYDGYIGLEGQSTKISNMITDTIVHKWRSEIDAIMVGTNTAVIDNPSLTTRHVTGKSPLRIVLDRDSRIPHSNKLLSDDEPAIIFGAVRDDIESDLKTFVPNNEHQPLTAILKYLHTEGIQSLMIEGGRTLLRSFITEGLWDEARIIRSKVKLEAGIKAPLVKGELAKSYTSGSDEVIILRNPVTKNELLAGLG